MITRRALLALGAVSLATPLSACSVDSLDKLRPAPKKPKVDNDAALVASVRAAMQRARLVATGTPFEALHTAQLAALGPDPSPTTPTPGPARGDAEQVRASETALQHRLLVACGRARAGQLATVFASMAAGIAQELAA